MKKVIPCLLTLLLALALCACSWHGEVCEDYDELYEDEDFLAGACDIFVTESWWGNAQDDGACAMKGGGYTGFSTLYAFTVEQDQTACEVTSTLSCSSGEAKLLVVNTDDRTIAAAWPVGSGDPMTVTLPAADYKLRIAGKGAEFEGQVTLLLDGQVQEWDNMPEEKEQGGEGWDVLDFLMG